MKQIFFVLFMLIGVEAVTAQTYPVMVKVEGGTFTMGSNSNDADYDEMPVHSVTVSSFNMGKYEISVAEYKAFCTSSGRTLPVAPHTGWNDKYPMVNINFFDANAYCKWLSEATGKNWRLPTEAEWEYAARGGRNSHGYIYAGSNDLDEVGWSSDNSIRQTQVGGKKSNELGLFDMSGSVWEWCRDWYDANYYAGSSTANPIGPVSGTTRVLRGGSWYRPAAGCRVANRTVGIPESYSGNIGFRVVVSE